MKKSLINDLYKVDGVINNHGYADHLVIGIDVGEDGQPNAGVLLSHGSPIHMLGMIDTIISDLEVMKQDIIKKTTVYKETKYNREGILSVQKKMEIARAEISKLIEKLPPELAEKVKIFQANIDKLIKEGDPDILEKVYEKLKNTKDIREVDEIVKDFIAKSKNEDDDYNIEDFKNQ